MEEELVGKKGDNDVTDEEAGGRDCDSQGKDKAVKQSSAVTKILTQAFTLTFLAEWGDRSQVRAALKTRHTARGAGGMGKVAGAAQAMEPHGVLHRCPRLVTSLFTAHP